MKFIKKVAAGLVILFSILATVYWSLNMREYLNDCENFNQSIKSIGIDEIVFKCSKFRSYIIPTSNYRFVSTTLNEPRIGPAGLEESRHFLDMLSIEVIKEVYAEQMTSLTSENINKYFSELHKLKLSRVKHIRLINNIFGYYDIFLSYNHSDLKAIIVCDNYCHNSLPQFILVEKKT